MYYIHNDSRLLNKYRRLVTAKCLKNKSLNEAIQKSAQELYAEIELGSSDCPILSCWKSLQIREIESPPRINMKEYRKRYINMIVKHATKEGDKPRKFKQYAFLKTTKKNTDTPAITDVEPFPDQEPYIVDYVPDIYTISLMP